MPLFFSHLSPPLPPFFCLTSLFMSMLYLPQTGRKTLVNVLTWNRKNQILHSGICPTAKSLNLRTKPTDQNSRCPLCPAMAPLRGLWSLQRHLKPRQTLRRNLSAGSVVRLSAQSPTSTSTSTEFTKPRRSRAFRGPA